MWHGDALPAMHIYKKNGRKEHYKYTQAMGLYKGYH